MEGTDTTTDIKSTAEITNWLPDGLHRYLPSHVGPNLKKLGLAGHSRGGKAAFALTLGKVTNVTTDLKFSALILLMVWVMESRPRHPSSHTFLSLSIWIWRLW